MSKSSISSTRSHEDKKKKKTQLFKKPFDGVLIDIYKNVNELSVLVAPLTKHVYHMATDKLEDIKHKYLPQIVSELERMALRPGVLTGSVIEQMDKYYTQIATHVNKLSKVKN